MRVSLIILMACLGNTASVAAAGGSNEPRDSATAYSAVDACFVLDTTGSMSSAIDAAREKIWFIATRIVDSPRRPDVRLCLMAFRDRGDDYVTRLEPLTGEIDRIYDRLKRLEANGGGDTPEAVHQALMETVLEAGWSPDLQTLRVIFLIGDAPPQHYPGEPGYPQISDAARARGIVINPVLVGSNDEARKAWERINQSAPGQMIDMPVVRTARRTTTPLDQDLVALDARLNATRLPYADSPQEDASEMPEASDGAIVERLEFGAATGRVFHRRGDLLQDLDSGVMSMERVDPASLPPGLRSMTRDELVQRLGVIRDERQALTLLIERLLDQRRLLLDATSTEGDFEKKVAEVIVNQLAQSPLNPTSPASTRTGSAPAPPRRRK